MAFSLGLALLVAACGGGPLPAYVPRPTVDTGPRWFDQRRAIDLTGDGKSDVVGLVAIGRRSDSLRMVLFAIVGSDTLELGRWDSDYELIDPPFDRDTVPQAVVDSFMAKRLAEVLGDVSVTVEQVTRELMAESPQGCDDEEDLAACLHTYWGLQTVNGRDPAADIIAAPVPLVSFGFGYETSVTVAWVASVRRFLGISACC